MKTYGIPEKALPVEKDGSIATQNSARWLKMLEDEEKHWKTNRRFDKVTIPRNQDVLRGKGEPLRKFIGNETFRRLLEASKPAYDDLSKPQKSEFIIKLIGVIHSAGGRFLGPDEAEVSDKEGSGCWVELSEDKAREKVAKALCDMRYHKQGPKHGAANRNHHHKSKKQRVSMEGGASILSCPNPSAETSSCCDAKLNWLL